MNNKKYNIFAVGLFPNSNKKLLAMLCRHFRVFVFAGQAFEPEFGPKPEPAEKHLTTADFDIDTEDFSWQVFELLKDSEARFHRLAPGHDIRLTREDFKSIYPSLAGTAIMVKIFRKTVERFGIDMVITNADYSGPRRPVVLEAKKLGIPTFNIEHGFFGSSPGPAAFRANSDMPPLVFVSDFVSLDNELERDYWQSVHALAGRENPSRFVVNGTPNDHSFDTAITRAEALRTLGLREDRFTITIASTWLEPHLPAAAVVGQIEHVDYFKKALRVAAELKNKHDIQIIVKMHPAFGVNSKNVWEDAVRFLKQQAAGCGFAIDLISLTKLSEVIAGSDLVVCPNVSSLIWEFFLAGKPGLILCAPYFYRDYYDFDKLNESNELFKRGCMEFVFTEGEFRDAVLKYADPARYSEYQKLASAVRKEKKLGALNVEQKCQNICNWMLNYLDSAVLSEPDPATALVARACEVPGGSAEAEAPYQPPRLTLVTGVRPDLIGVHVSITCDACGTTFEHLLATVAGNGIGKFPCPHCDAIHHVWPEDFLRALDKFLPERDVDSDADLNDEAAAVTEQWYRHSEMAEVFQYEGINLGEAMERMLNAYVSVGLLLEQRRVKQP